MYRAAFAILSTEDRERERVRTDLFGGEPPAESVQPASETDNGSPTDSGLESNNQEQLIFKHAISTVVVSRPVHGGLSTAAAATQSAPSPMAASSPEAEV